MNGEGSRAEDAGASASLDHVLLESLFYNEMMQMDDSSLLVSEMTAAVSSTSSSIPPPEEPRQQESSDPNVIAEKDLLRDFGVTHSPIPNITHHPGKSVVVETAVDAALSGDSPTLNEVPKLSAVESPRLAVHQSHGLVITQGVPHASQQNHPQHQQRNIFYQQKDVTAENSAYSISTSREVPHLLPREPLQIQPSHPQVVNYAPHQHNGQPPDISSQSDSRKKKQLLSQFATLADRLGIKLEPSVLQSLSNSPGSVRVQQAINDAAIRSGNRRLDVPSNPHLQAGGSDPNFSSVHVNLAPRTSVSARDPPPMIQTVFLQKSTRESHVDEDKLNRSSTNSSLVSRESADVLKREDEGVQSRKRSSPEDSNEDSEILNEGNTNSNTNGSNGTAKAPTHSKRRKKPRLTDCESKLAHLKAENALLKRHLDNITNKAADMEMERCKAEEKMKQLMNAENSESNAAELNEILQKYQDMHADYGRRRQQELNFHLEQLQRVANPSNFTKMGLWTMQQDVTNHKKHPIAGILQAELTISAQQARKILDQRERIRTLCDNIKASIELLAKLKDLCQRKTTIFKRRMNKVREILTPFQVVKLLMWINDHTNVLGSVCPGWGSEDIPKAKKSTNASASEPSKSS